MNEMLEMLNGYQGKVGWNLIQVQKVFPPIDIFPRSSTFSFFITSDDIDDVISRRYQAAKRWMWISWKINYLQCKLVL